MSVKKILAIAILPLTLISGNLAYAADTPDEQFSVQAPPTSDRYTGINLADESFAKHSLSSLEAMTADGTSFDSTLLTRTPCKKVGDKGCEPNKFFQFNALIGRCDSSLVTDCVNKVYAIDSSGQQIEGEFVEAFPGQTSNTYVGDPSLDLPTGSSAFIVRFPGITHAGGNDFLIVNYMSGYRGFNESKFTIQDFKSAIFAISRISAQCAVPTPDTNIRPDHKLNGRAIQGGGCDAGKNDGTSLPCAMASANQCALPWPLPTDVTFGFSLKMHEKIKGWLHGRLNEAAANITTAADGDQLLNIQGKPSVVPGIQAWFRKDALPAPLKTYYSNVSETYLNAMGGGWPSTDRTKENGPDGLPYSILKEGFGYDEGGFKEVLAWINATGDKATYAPTVWSIRSMQSSQFDNCMKGSDSLSGIVSTNSTMYIGNPPTFDKDSQSLDYKVMSPHSLPNGTEFKGSYDLVIKSDVARCIYGFSNAPVSAKISILSSDGTTQVATTTFNERNGWMYLVARGFTFSSPTVRVKLMQEAAPSATPTPASDSTAAPKKSTITCAKGKSTKKVTATKPACPSGWKKK